MILSRGRQSVIALGFMNTLGFSGLAEVALMGISFLTDMWTENQNTIRKEVTLQ